AGRRRLVSGGNRVSGPVQVWPERGTGYMVLLGTGLIVLLLGVVTNALCPSLAGGSYLSFLILSGEVACGRCKRRH
ncbi:hypothetical protein WKH50_24290, partial [Pantoea agglomerans]|uniref:hypothetical protein n=1 Tax=Enterobacter agglomerans TaxID=549 RepID=UPI003C7D4D88